MNEVSRKQSTRLLAPQRLGLVLLIGLAGCFSASAAQEEFFYHLSGPQLAREQATGPRLALVEFSAAPGYTATSLAYRQKDHELRYWGYRRWVASPPKLVADMTARHLRASGQFAEVERDSEMVQPDAILWGHLMAFEEIDRDGFWEARLAMVYRLKEPDGDAVLLTYAFDKKRRCDRRHPEAVAKALSELLAQEMKELATAIADALTN